MDSQIDILIDMQIVMAKPTFYVKTLVLFRPIGYSFIVIWYQRRMLKIIN